MPRVLIVDDDKFTRTTLASLVREAEPNSEVQVAGTVLEAMSIAHELRPGIAILDLDLGEGPTGADLAHGLRRLDASIALLMLTSYEHPSQAGPIRDLPDRCAYLVKGDLGDVSVLVDAMAHARSGDAASLRHQLSADLSDSQWTLMRLVAAGYTNAEIARRTDASESAVNKANTRLVHTLNIGGGAESNVRVLIAREYFHRTGTISERR